MVATIDSYETANGVRYRVRYRKPDGGQTAKRGFVRKRDAVEFLQALEVGKRAGDYVAPASGRATLGPLAEAWLKSKHSLAASSSDRTAGIVTKQIVEPHGDVAISKITREWVRAWVAAQVKDYAPDTISKHASTFRQVLDQAVDDRLIARNPFDGVDLPTVVAAEKRFLTVDQLKALTDAAGSNAAFVWVLAMCGLRFGEAAALRHGDLNRATGQLDINRSVSLVNARPVVAATPKGGGRRTVFVPAFVVELLPTGDADTLIFSDARGGYLRANNVRRRWWAKAVEAAGIYPEPEDPVKAEEWNPFTFHELRHTAASLAIQSGASIKAVQNMLGHRSAALTLDRYGHLYPSEVAAVAEAMGNMFDD